MDKINIFVNELQKDTRKQLIIAVQNAMKDNWALKNPLINKKSRKLKITFIYNEVD